ncbi:MAG: 16S rRNA (cytosine(1402)-N(4))-methyltransferase RsmH [Patescibacteria group bacterium]
MQIMARTSKSVRGTHRLSREEGGKLREQPLVHVSVMPHEVLAALDLQKSDIVVDATYGAGGHSAAIKKAGVKKLVTMDADSATKPDIVGNFGDIGKLVDVTPTKILFDLGWNRGQLASGRGFSFMYEEPLNMSYGAAPRSGFTAAEMLNTFSEQALSDVLYGYGEERYARRIAAQIVERRATAPFATTTELVELIRDAVPAGYRHGRTNPATKSFQALRIAVNDELGVLRQGLEQAWEVLAPGGRIAVITFHSIEDRVVKNLFKEFGGERISKKPIVPTREEVVRNPASRSAKLRVIKKV